MLKQIQLQWYTKLDEDRLPNDFDYHTHKETPNGILVSIICDYKLLGFMAYSLYKDHFELKWLHIFPEYRRLGYGKMCLKIFSEKMYKTRNYIKFNLSEDNLPAQLFLQECGYFGWPNGKNIEFRLTLREEKVECGE